jgi:lipopolysaccharide export LptBFGC system permease protein LptF
MVALSAGVGDDAGPSDMPRILLRHILADLLRLNILTTSVLVAVIAFGAAIRPIMQNLLGAEDLLEFVLLASVPMLQFAIPFGAAFAGTLVYARLAADNEITAMSAAGLSYRKVLLPAIALGVILLVAMVALLDLGVPRLGNAMRGFLKRDPTRLFVAAVAKGEALQIGETQLYADDVRVEPFPLGPDGPSARLTLAGIAAVELGRDGRTTTEFTAEFATVDVYQREEGSFLKLLFQNATAFRDGDDALVYVPQAEPEVIELGSGVKATPKDMDLRELLALWGDIDGYHAVRDARVAVEESLDVVARWRCIERALGPDGPGSLRFADAGGRRIYEIRNATLEGTRLVPRSGGSLELIELERGVATRRATVSEASIAAETRRREGGLRFEILSRADTVADLRGLGGGGRWPPRIVGLLPEGCVPPNRSADPAATVIEEARRVAAESGGRAEESAALPIERAARAAGKAATQLETRVRKTRGDIVARIVQRANQALCAPLMLVLGAVLAIRLRGANPLQVYLLAFIPSIIDILLISGGEQRLKSELSAVGIVVATSGNVLLLAMILHSYRRIARN